ncbi:MAG: acetyltransferase [Acidobacteriales bacterium]|nr:acetyltransferase [Terriglobales bacterium]
MIVGAGGLGREYAWVADEMNLAADRSGTTCMPWRVLGYIDDAAEKCGMRFGRYVVHGSVEAAAKEFASQDISFAVAVGNNFLRERLARAAEALGWHPATLIHPSAIVAEGTQVGAGTYVAAGCIICPGVLVGNHVIVNTHVSVGHDSVLEDYVQVCPGARVSGGCRVGRHALLGSNASLTPRVTVGERAVVGANSHAVRNVAPGTTVMGCPARVLPGVHEASR